MLAIAVLIVGLLMIGYAVVLYNALVRLKHGVSKAWSNIDVLLTQRHAELPKLVETCKHYMAHERETLTQVVAARNQVANAQAQHDLKALGAAETGLRQGLIELFALAENYPELKADQGFQFLQQRISALESAIADRRELYNEAVNLNNVRIEQFPDVLIAKKFAFTKAELLQFTDQQKADVDLKSLFG